MKLGLDERATTRRWFPVLLALLIAVGGVGGWITYESYAAPTATVDRETVTVWESDAYFDYRGVVAVENSVYPVGTELPDREFYLQRIVPDFEGELVYAYRTAGDGEVTVTADLFLVYHEVDGRTGTEYWRVVDRLDSVERTIAPGEDLRVPFELDVPAVERRLEATRAEVGQLPARTDSEVQVLVRTSAVGTVDGERVREFNEYALPVRFQRDVYVVVDPRVTTTTHEAVRTTVVPVEPDPVARTGGPALVAVGLLGTAALTVLRHRGAFDLTEAERAYLDFRADRAAFDDWITTFTPAEEVAALPRTDAASLADLVDFAINTDSGVIESPDGERFLVVHGGHRYCYRAPPHPGDDGVADPGAGSEEPTGDAAETPPPALTEGSTADATLAGDGGVDSGEAPAASGERSPVEARGRESGDAGSDDARGSESESDDVRGSEPEPEDVPEKATVRRSEPRADETGTERPQDVHRAAAEEMVGGRLPTHTTADRRGDVPDWLKRIADDPDE